jgi:hypothetical protein
MQTHQLPKYIYSETQRKPISQKINNGELNNLNNLEKKINNMNELLLKLAQTQKETLASVEFIKEKLSQYDVGEESDDEYKNDADV